MSKSNLKRKPNTQQSFDELQEEMKEVNSFYLDFSGDSRIATASDPQPGKDRIQLKATTLAEAKLEVMQLVRKNPHLRHLEIFQGGEKISSCQRVPRREWSQWKQHAQPVEPDNQPFETKFEKLEELARAEINKSAALIDAQNKEPARYKKTFLGRQILNPEHKVWRLAVANLQEEQSQARDVFNAEHQKLKREQKDLSLNDDIKDDEKVVPLAAVQNSDVESEQRSQTRQPVGKPAHK